MLLKRWILGVLCVVALLCVLPRETRADNQLLFADPSSAGKFARDMAVVNDTLYLLTDRLWKLAPGDLEQHPVEGKNISGEKIACLVRGNGELGLIYQATGKMATFNNDEVVQEDSIPNWDELTADERNVSQIRHAVRIGDKVCLLILNDDTSCTLWCFDIAAGTGGVIAENSSIANIHAYKENMLLAVAQFQDGTSSVVVINPATGEEASVLYTSAKGENLTDAVYDAQNDSIWVITNNQAKQVTDKLGSESEAVMLNVQVPSYFAWAEFLPTNRLAFIAAGSVGIYDLDTSRTSNALRIMGGRTDASYTSYNLAHPEAPAILDDRLINNSESVMMDILSGQGSDLYIINASYGLQALADKGYLGDFSASESLMSQVQEMYPWAQNALLQDGKLVAFPYSVKTGLWVINTEGFEKIGLEYPASMDDLFTLIELWDDGLAEQYPEYALFAGQIDRQILAEQIIRSYVTQYEEPGKQLLLNQPIMRRLLARVAELPLPLKIPQSEDAQALISIAGTPFERFQSLKYSYPIMFIPPPALEEGQRNLKVSANMDVYILNPKSSNTEQALKYMTYVAEQMETGIRYLLNPNLTEQVRDPEMQQRIEDRERVIAEQEAQLVVSDEKDKKTLADAIAENQQALLSMEARSWLVSAVQLKQYRAIAPQIDLNLNSLIINFDSREGDFEQTVWGQLTKLLRAYFEGQMSLETALAEMDKKAKMAYLEGR